jgi:hypothetical protein
MEGETRQVSGVEWSRQHLHAHAHSMMMMRVVSGMVRDKGRVDPRRARARRDKKSKRMMRRGHTEW